MVKATNASIVTISLVFLTLILSIVGVVTPFFINKRKNGYEKLSIYNLKAKNKDGKINETVDCDSDGDGIKHICTASQVLGGLLLGFNSILFLLSLFIIFTGYNVTLRAFCIVLNTLLLFINILLIISLIVYYKILEETNNPSNRRSDININLGPAIIMLGINAIIIIITTILLSNLRITKRPPTF